MFEYLAFRFAAALSSVIPFRLMYVISDGLAFVLHRVIRYRRGVVRGNLERSFPTKTEEELRRIERNFYRHLGDISLESLKGLGMSKAELDQRYRYLNPELLDQAFDDGRNVILMPAHYGNWEWGVLSLPLPLKHGVVGVYKPLKNPRVEAFAARRRTRFGLQLCPLTETRTALEADWPEPVLFIFMADQSPSNSRKAHWLTFLHQDTACLQGADVWARKLDLPVFFMETNRVKRGHYEIRFREISSDPAKTEEEAITRAYFRLLEEVIRKQPSDWLWSHKRWKKKRENLPEGHPMKNA